LLKYFADFCLQLGEKTQSGIHKFC
jgi:hypothetical protein